MLALGTTLLAGSARADVPSGLACLAKFYAIDPVQTERGWVGHLPDGTSVPWDDGSGKSVERALDQPDLHDMLRIPYHPGPIVAVTDPDDDPGRIRVDALFAATYPRDRIVRIDFLGHRLQVHARAKDAFLRVATRLAQLAPSPWLRTFSGTFVVRAIAGTHRPSSHGYGVSIDLDSARTDYWRWQRPKTPLRWRNTVPQDIVDAFEAEGFIWGGRWYHYDTMHFEWRPELLGCASE